MLFLRAMGFPHKSTTQDYVFLRVLGAKYFTKFRFRNVPHRRSCASRVTAVVFHLVLSTVCLLQGRIVSRV